MKNNRESFEQILQVCLELLFSGSETVDTLLARYPDVADELRPDLEAAELLRAWKKDLAPRPGFVSASRHRVMAHIQEDAPAGMSLLQMLRDPLFWQDWLNKNIVRLALVGMFILAMMISAGQIAEESQQALPGDSYYGVKLALERVELAFTLDETKDAALNVKFTERRLNELHFLAEANRFDEFPEFVEAFESQLNQTVQSLGSAADANGNTTKILSQALANILAREEREVNKIVNRVPIHARPSLERYAEISDKGQEVVAGLIASIEPTADTPVPDPTRTPARSAQQEETPTSAPTRTAPPTRTPRPTPTSPPLDEEPVFVIPTKDDPASPTPALPTVAITPLPSSTPYPYTTSEPTDTPEPTSTNTPRPTFTNTPQPTDTPEPTETNTPRPTATDTPEPTNTPEPTETNTPRPTATDTPEPTDTPTEVSPELLPTGTSVRTSTPTPTPGTADPSLPPGTLDP